MRGDLASAHPILVRPPKKKEDTSITKYIHIHMYIYNIQEKCLLYLHWYVLDLEVYVLNADTEIGDLHFPHSYDSDSTIHLSEATIKQYSRNGTSCHSFSYYIHGIWQTTLRTCMTVMQKAWLELKTSNPATCH